MFGSLLGGFSRKGEVEGRLHFLEVSTDSDVNDAMILTNLSKIDKIYPVYLQEVLSSYYPYYTKQLKEITISRKLYHQINNSFIFVYSHNHTNFQSLVYLISNEGFSG